MHDLFNDTVFNTECAAQNFVRLFIVLQHAKSIGSVKLHVCVRVRACVHTLTLRGMQLQGVDDSLHFHLMGTDLTFLPSYPLEHQKVQTPRERENQLHSTSHT